MNICIVLWKVTQNNWWSQLHFHSKSYRIFFSYWVLHRIIKYTDLEGAFQRIIESNPWPCTGPPKNYTMCPGVLSKHLLNSVRLDHFPGEPESPSFPLFFPPLPNISATLNLGQLFQVFFPLPLPWISPLFHKLY